MPSRLLNILVVDDNPALCEIMSLELESLGHGQFGVTSCGGLEEALKALEQDDFGLIVADYSLAAATAVDFLTQVDAKEPKNTSKRYIVSGYGHQELAPKFARTKVDRYYQKPVEFDQLALDIAHDFSSRYNA